MSSVLFLNHINLNGPESILGVTYKHLSGNSQKNHKVLDQESKT